MVAAERSATRSKKIAAWARSIGLPGGYADQRVDARPLASGSPTRSCSTRCAIASAWIERGSGSRAPRRSRRRHLEFFLSLGIPVLEVYGMSECSGPATYSPPDRLSDRQERRRFLPGTELQDRRRWRSLHARSPTCSRGTSKIPRRRRTPSTRTDGSTPATSATIDADGFLQNHRSQEGFPDHRGRRERRPAAPRGGSSSRSPSSARPWWSAIRRSTWPRW